MWEHNNYYFDIYFIYSLDRGIAAGIILQEQLFNRVNKFTHLGEGLMAGLM